MRDEFVPYTKCFVWQYGFVFFTCSSLSGMSIVQYERKAAKLHNKPTKITMHTFRCKRWQLDCEILIFILGGRIIPALHEKWLTSINWFNCSAVKWARAENIDFKNFFQIRFETVYRAGETSVCRLGLQGGSVWIQQIQIPWIGDLSNVHPISHLMTAGTASSPTLQSWFG